MKVCQSRKSTHSIMAGAGSFSGITLHRKDGITMEIPQKLVKKDGSLKVHIPQEVTREVGEFLESKGVQIYVGLQA